MPKKKTTSAEKAQKLKFSHFITSRIVTVTVARLRIFYIHSDLIKTESERFQKNLEGDFKEASESAIDVEDEEPNLFGFFVEYLYRDCSILSSEVKNPSTYVTLARIYAMGERLVAPKFQDCALRRFSHALGTSTQIAEESICELLRIACMEITERVRRDDPMRSLIFWYAASKIGNLQKSDMFRQLLCDIPDAGRQLCLMIGRSRPEIQAMQSKPQDQFESESEYDLQSIPEVVPEET